MPRGLFKPRAIPGWAFFAWAVAGHMSTLQFSIGIVKHLGTWLQPVLPWLMSPGGRFYSLIFGLVWLSAIAWGPKPPAKDDGLTALDLAVLRFLVQDLKSYRVVEIASAFSMPMQRASYQIDRLVKSGDVRRDGFDILDPLGGLSTYSITAKGRDALVQRQLL
jgi:hypothetical protein